MLLADAFWLFPAASDLIVNGFDLIASVESIDFCFVDIDCRVFNNLTCLDWVVIQIVISAWLCAVGFRC